MKHHKNCSVITSAFNSLGCFKIPTEEDENRSNLIDKIVQGNKKIYGLTDEKGNTMYFDKPMPLNIIKSTIMKK